MNFENPSNCAGNISKASVPFKLKQFVSASPQSNLNEHPQNHIPSLCYGKENGDIVSNFYLDVCSIRESSNRSSSSDDDDDVIICNFSRRKSTEQAEFNSDQQITINRAMKCAQYDDIEGLKHIIMEGLSINTTDAFGWSLLMVASYAGSKSIVKYLVNEGARKGKRDSKGNTALYLASKKNHMDIVDLLITKKETSSLEKDPATEEIEIIENLGIEARFCEVCNMTPTCSSKEHETSIAHLFQLGPSTSRTMYDIPRNNVGFQMLLQQGWNEAEGLGPEGEGRKFPIKVKEKQDKVGFGHNSSEELQSSTKENRHQLLSQKEAKYREKQKEKHFRRLLNEPDF